MKIKHHRCFQNPYISHGKKVSYKNHKILALSHLASEG